MDTRAPLGHSPAAMGRKTRKKDPLAPEIGKRINQAWRDAGFETLASFVHSTRIDPRLMSRYLAGDVMPGVRPLMRVAEVCRVSLDWLVLGTEEASPALLEWLETPIGKSAPEPARRYLRALPIRGYRPSLQFYDMTFLGWQNGLTAEDAVTAARTTERALSDKPDAGS